MVEENLIIKSLNKKENIQDKKDGGKGLNKSLGKKPYNKKDSGKKKRIFNSRGEGRVHIACEIDRTRNLILSSLKYEKDEGEKLADQKEILESEKEGLPLKYQYSHIPMEEVVKNIDEYIIPELQDPCVCLWDRNIFTFMVSNRNDGGSSYICLDGNLSEKNQKIWDELSRKYPKKYYKDAYRNALTIKIEDTTKMTEREITNEFMHMVLNFELQDVPSKFYLNKEQYLIKCGCYDEIPNPEYIDDVGPMPQTANLEELDEWIAKTRQPETIKIFNKNKKIKSLKKYVKENGDIDKFDVETGRVYTNKYFLERHNYYKDMMLYEEIRDKYNLD